MTLKAKRAKLGISQRDLALLLGISLDSVQNWEQGRRRTPAWALKRTDQLMGATPHDLRELLALEKENVARQVLAKAEGDVGTAAAMAAMSKAERLLAENKISPLAFLLAGEAALYAAEGFSLLAWQKYVTIRKSISFERLTQEIESLRQNNLLPWA